MIKLNYLKRLKADTSAFDDRDHQLPNIYPSARKRYGSWRVLAAVYRALCQRTPTSLRPVLREHRHHIKKQDTLL